MLAQIDPERTLVALLLLGAGMFLATLLVRPPPRGSQLQPREQEAQCRRRFALRGMSLMTLAGLGSGLWGGLLEQATGESRFAQVLHAIYRVCWLPAYLMRDLQLALAPLGSGAFDSQLPTLLGLLLVPVFWFLVFFGAARWLPLGR